MPRYFFHITDGKKTHADAKGADLLDEECAAAFAKMLVENLLDDAKYSSYFVDVRDEHDQPVVKMYISTRH